VKDVLSKLFYIAGGISAAFIIFYAMYEATGFSITTLFYLTPEQCYDKYSKQLEQKGALLGLDYLLGYYPDSQCNAISYYEYYDFSGRLKPGVQHAPTVDKERVEQINQVAAEKNIEGIKRLVEICLRTNLCL
jgi:hypothetical protein